MYRALPLCVLISMMSAPQLRSQGPVTLHIVDSSSGVPVHTARIVLVDVVDGVQKGRISDDPGGTRSLEVGSATRFVAIEAAGFARRVVSARQLRRGGALTVGLLPTRTLSGHLVDGMGGAPLKGTVQVKIEQEGNATTHAVQTDDTGGFSIDVPFGAIGIAAWAAGYSVQTLAVPSQPPGPLLLQLSRAGRAEGELRGDAGQGVSGATVSLKPADTRTPITVFATTDTRGRFELRNVTAGALYTMVVDRPGCTTETLGTLTLSSGEERTDLALQAPPCRQ